jgi:hypothetical protein
MGLLLTEISIRSSPGSASATPETSTVCLLTLLPSFGMATRMTGKLLGLDCSLAIEGELSDKRLAALSKTSDSMAKELAKMLMAKSESGESQSLKDIWAAYRKKEVQVEVMINKSHTEPEAKPKPISKEEAVASAPEITKAST